MPALTDGIPPGTRNRLVEHYGSDVRAWLRRAEAHITAAASRADITVDGFHDAGWTSVVGVGRFSCGVPVILKAFPYADHYYRERAALEHWAGHGACRLFSSDDATRVLLIELIGGAPGGSAQPSDHVERIADALSELHRRDADINGPVPTLRNYYRRTVLPRIQKGAPHVGTAIGEGTVRRAVEVGANLCALPHRDVMLHSDLYAENILFNQDRSPVFIDPDPKVGAPAFDWAFWCVFYQENTGFSTRLTACRSRVPALVDEVLAWALTLAVGRAMYYLENNNSNAVAMRSVLSSPELAILRNQEPRS
jgi:streptomycin 6-kinase